MTNDEITEADVENEIERVIAAWTATIEAMPGDDPHARVLAAASFFSQAASRLCNGHVTCHVRANGTYLVAAPERGTVDMHATPAEEATKH